MARLTLCGIALCLSIVLTRLADAAVIFSDNFNSGASALWGNEVGIWTASGGVYSAQSPNNTPPTYSSLPFMLTDFAVEVDIENVRDGGIWLRSADNENGVLLITGGRGGGSPTPGPDSARALYWHIIENGVVGAIQGEVPNAFTPDGDYHLRVEVTGSTYSAFVNGSTSPLTTLVTNAFASGKVGLYDFSTQSFDNVILEADHAPVPEPTSLATWGILASLCAVRIVGRRSAVRKRAT